MAMEGVRSSLLAALLFLTLLVLAAASSGGGDAAAATDAVEEHPLSDAPYMLVAFHNKDGEEIRLLSDKGTETLSASGFANRSGHWFYTIRDGKGGNKRRRRLPQSNNAPASRGSSRTEAEGFWNTLGALANTTAASRGDPADDEGYMLIGMQTSGGDKIRVVVVADQRYFFITGNAKGFSCCPRWFFRDDGERHRLVTALGGDDDGPSSSHGGGSSSHAEVLASNVLAALIKDGRARQARNSCG